MQKTLLLGAALLVGVTGFSQNIAKKVVNPKYLKKAPVDQRTAFEPQQSAGSGIKLTKKSGYQSTMSGCNTAKKITTSWNAFGVGGGGNTSTQNCLSYNKDLNVISWTQRGSNTWQSLITTSGSIQTTIINPATLATDSVITYKDANSAHHARYPGGVLLNPTGNTNYHNALACVSGQVIDDGTTWQGTAYCAKPLWSASAVNHAAPHGDSLFTSGLGAAGATFGRNTAGSYFIGGAVNDMQTLPDGKTVLVAGFILDPAPAFNSSGDQPGRKAGIGKGTLDVTGQIVNWTVDSSITPNVYVGGIGYVLSEPRMAFGPDGLHGYIVFLGILNNNNAGFGNPSADSAMTPIVYKTVNGGGTWTQVLAGYDWMCHHGEVDKNVGKIPGLENDRFYTFDPNQHGADLTVDANNVLHYVTTVKTLPNLQGNIDSIATYGVAYDYDYANYHPLIWDFMTDGTDWKTLFVDSILSAPIAGDGQTNDSTNAISPMGGTQPLAISSHITVSRSTDGSTIFYGWADSDPGVLGTNATGATYNSNPNLLIKAYNVNTNMISATKEVMNTGNCFYPFLSDVSYNDGTQWVVPAVFTAGHIILGSSPYTTYDASSQADYYYTNCGTFAASDFATVATVFTSPSSGCSTDGLGIQKVNAFASSINNYPNPFSTTTTIAVTLSENKAFSVNVYNAIGTLVYSKKVNGNIGENSVTFDAGSLSSGVYYYTVNAGNQQATKKMVIQK